MEKHLSENCLNPTFIDAVYGKDLTQDEINQCYSSQKTWEKLGREMSMGEIGCFLSHLKIYRKMVTEKIERALIMEDDIEIHPELGNICHEITQQSVHWEIVLLGHHSRFSREQKTPTSLWGKSPLSSQFTLCRPCDLGQGTYGYMINLFGAKRLLKLMDKIDKPIDHFTGSDHYTNLYIVNPPIIGINQYLSDDHHSMEDRSTNMQNSSQQSYFDIIKNAPLIRHLIILKDSLRAFYYSIRPIKKYN
jgi:glycosyl transferase family 25